ncbi:transcriptional regulator, AraC family [Paraglaciecola sp. T6c]|uniref:AraC family transcriptional regulator n=1 Tax=Pseudoalteromonas atlantica (strain T6c / ATCC BAA-1087) TaxID=3042615 RepID=UPI00005C7263|nr:AraC family transcriptional regulator [Paraglaciecola sp. T6c]ABG41486.1 transcriptional regulator, AraC family [Paraglaciecola sp. T6c]
MSKELIRQLIDAKAGQSGMIETRISGVQLFKITEPIRCAPALYEPSVTAIVSGGKEAIWNGNKHYYDKNKYICCTMSMPIEAGTPEASPDNPLMGVYISLNTRVMTELAIELESATGVTYKVKESVHPQGISTANWDEAFTDALYRLIMLEKSTTDIAILGSSRIRELYYAILKGDSGYAVRRSFGVGNEIARSIELLSSNLNESVTIENLAHQVGMSRAVFHRKFKQATSMSPIQFVKSMRLNNAAMKIAEGRNVNVAAMEVGYVSSSQFSRDFKRMYGQAPKQWSQTIERKNNRV